MGHDHDHDHGRGGAQEHEGIIRTGLSDTARRVYAIRDLLVEKGVFTHEEVRQQIRAMDARSPATGARLVARAWIDPEFRARLVADPKAVCREMGIDAGAPELVVLENSEQVRNVVVCTLCSCYPRAVLGRPPDWYKSFNYRSRVVVDPRGVLAEFGTSVPPGTQVNVYDSTADVRYLVIPVRPAGTEGLSEDELAQLVTRDSMIGVEDALAGPVAATP